MPADTPDWRPSLIPALFYRDPKAALTWLENAFGFELFMLIEDGEGTLAHAEMRFGDAAVMIGNEWDESSRSPASLDRKTTQSIHTGISADVDAHCAKAKAAGAEILMEPADQFYGARTYRCRDPEGHIWTIAQTTKVVTREEAEAATGLKITGWV